MRGMQIPQECGKKPQIIDQYPLALAHQVVSRVEGLPEGVVRPGEKNEIVFQYMNTKRLPPGYGIQFDPDLVPLFLHLLENKLP